MFSEALGIELTREGLLSSNGDFKLNILSVSLPETIGCYMICRCVLLPSPPTFTDWFMSKVETDWAVTTSPPAVLPKA